MNGGKVAMLIAGTVGVLAGSYIVFVEGNSLGGVFIALGAIFFALSNNIGANGTKGDDDAG